MAEISFPTAVQITQFDIGLFVPGQVNLASPYTGTVSTLTRGAGLWRGSCGFALTDSQSESDAMAVEVFLASMANLSNDSNIPLKRATPERMPAGFAISSASSLVAGRIQYSLSPSALAYIKVGQYLRIADRIYLIAHLDPTGTACVLVPEVTSIDNGSVISRAEYIRVVQDPESRFVASPRSPDFHGPWSFSWVEKI